MPPRVPGYTLAEVVRAFHTDGWAINEGSKHTPTPQGQQNGSHTPASGQGHSSQHYGCDNCASRLDSRAVPATGTWATTITSLQTLRTTRTQGDLPSPCRQRRTPIANSLGLARSVATGRGVWWTIPLRTAPHQHRPEQGREALRAQKRPPDLTPRWTADATRSSTSRFRTSTT